MDEEAGLMQVLLVAGCRQDDTRGGPNVELIVRSKKYVFGWTLREIDVPTRIVLLNYCVPREIHLQNNDYSLIRLRFQLI